LVVRSPTQKYLELTEKCGDGILHRSNVTKQIMGNLNFIKRVLTLATS
jgi:hypothetical protein